MKNKITTLMGAALCLLVTFGVTYVASAQTVVTETQKLTASDGEYEDSFGISVSVEGDLAILGASGDDGHGSAYVFERIGGVWVETAKLTASDGVSGDAFGVSVSVSGNHAIVGAPSDDYRHGSAYVFEQTGGVWTQVAKLTDSDVEAQDRFGASVSVSGDYAFVGVPSNTYDYKPGEVYVYERIGGVWTQVIRLSASDGADLNHSSLFGASVSVSGDQAIVGAFWDDGNGLNRSGSAYVFDRIGGVWTETAKLTANDGATSDNFGYPVSISGDRAVVGAKGDDYGRGSAYVFERVGGVWTQVSKLTASDGASGDQFGWSVSVSGDHVVVGTPADDNGDSSGSAYLFERVGGVWTEITKLLPSDGAGVYSFSHYVSISGPYVFATSPSDYEMGNRSGAAYVFELISNQPPVADCGDDVTVEAVDAFGASVQLDGTASYDPDGDSLDFEWAVPAGSGAVLDDPTNATPIGVFPIGPTLVTLTVTDGNGGIDVCDVLVAVQDTTPPVLVCTTDLIALWPPKGDMVPVVITIAVSDISAPEDLILTCDVSSSEVDDSDGTGELVGDVNGSDGYTSPVPVDLVYDGTNFVATVELRAERDQSNKGRNYSIVCEVVDPSGNDATASCVVVVPHDKRKK